MKNSYQILADHYGRLVKIGKRNKVMCKIFKKVLSRRFNKLISGLSEEDKRLQVAHVETGEIVWNIELPHPAAQVAWHPCRYVLAYSADTQGLKIIGGVGGA